MSKSLDEMTNKELWQLFPIILVPYNPKWPVLYEKEKTILVELYGDFIERMNHIGSTSVSGLTAKPTIDILLEIKQNTNLEWFYQVAINAGYLVSIHQENPAPHFLLKKGYTPRGYVGQSFHIHVRYLNDYDELYFRDYLRESEEARNSYTSLKLSLKDKYVHDRNKYTDAKGDMIKRYTFAARKKYGTRY